jgi:CMP-N,N'-diacetyllegionaminic acid synthase
MNNLCIIPARSGSKGVPGKNKKLLNGKPLVEYTFEAACNAKHINKIILSTDCRDIASLAAAFNIEVPFVRPKHLAQDNTPTLPVIQHAIDFLSAQGEMFDNIILLQPTTPFRKEGFIDQCMETFISKNADSLVSVRPVPHAYNPHWVFEDDGAGILQVSTGDEDIIPSRQLLPKAYIRDGSVYVFKASNLQYNSIYGKKIAYHESDDLFHINIDTPDDWHRAELIAQMKLSCN